MTDTMTKSEGQERLLTGYSGRISILLALGWMSTLLGRQAVSPLLPTILESLDITPSRAGFALTLMMGLYAVLQYPGGRLSDQLSRTIMLIASLVAMMAGFSLLVITVSYPGFLLGVAMVGAGAGLFFSPSRALISDLFVERRGEVLGLQTAAGMIGGLLAAGTAAGALVLPSWRLAFVPPIVFLALVLLLLYRWSRESYTVSKVNLGVFTTGIRLLGSRRIRLLILGYAFFGFTLQGFIGFLPTLLQLEKGFSPGLASGGFALIYLVGIVSGPTAGNLSDRWPRRHIITLSLALEVLGLIVLLVAASPEFVAVGIAMAAFGIWGYVPTIQAYLMDLLPADSLGGDFGWLKTIYTGLGSLGPTYVGFVAEHANYSTAFGGLIVCLSASAIVLFVATRSGNPSP